MLTGGASRRMGTDKAFVTVDGVAMVRRVADVLHAAGVSVVVAIGGDRLRLAQHGLDCWPDRWPGQGPLGGLATALDRAPAGRVVVAGCDQPWLDPDLLAALADAIGNPGGPAATAAAVRVGSRIEPLPGCYPTAMAAALIRRFQAGARRLDVALEVADEVVAVDVADPATVGDVDRPGDLPGGTLSDNLTTVEVPVEAPEVDVATLAERRAAGTVVIDVRNPDEYAEGHVPGARLIPLPEVPERLAEVPTDQPVLVICKSGGRSLKATEHYLANGIDATNVAGGTMAWIDSGREVVAGDQPS